MNERVKTRKARRKTLWDMKHECHHKMPSLFSCFPTILDKLCIKQACQDICGVESNSFHGVVAGSSAVEWSPSSGRVYGYGQCQSLGPNPDPVLFNCQGTACTPSPCSPCCERAAELATDLPLTAARGLPKSWRLTKTRPLTLLDSSGPGH